MQTQETGSKRSGANEKSEEGGRGGEGRLSNSAKKWGIPKLAYLAFSVASWLEEGRKNFKV